MHAAWPLSPHTGCLEVICGPMFSGKTEELIRRLRLAAIARQRVQIFKSAKDVRYDETEIVSHADSRLQSEPITSADQIFAKLHPKTRVVGIDEAQFLGNELIAITQTLVDRGLRVIIAGLDQDFRGEPFEPMPQLLAIAEVITKQPAVCVICSAPATRTQRLVCNDDRVLVGASESYEARCRRCHDSSGHAQTEFLPRQKTKIVVSA